MKLLNTKIDQADFYVLCSKGTYIRSLAVDFAKHLSCLGSIARLTRIKFGNYILKDAIGLAPSLSINCITSAFVKNI